MNKSRCLNLLDICLHRKDFLWGKDYYGLLENGSLVDTLLFSDYHGSAQVIQIHSIENNSEELLRAFTHDYGQKQKIKYFLLEFDERDQIEEIALANKCGFKRYLRNYYYELRTEDFSPSSDVHVICREAEYEDIDQIMDLDCTAQALEYRDYLYSPKKYLRKQLADYYVFVDPTNLSRVIAFVFKREIKDGRNICEFVTNTAHSNMIAFCIEAFAERFIRFEKNISLHYALSSIHKDTVTELEAKHKLESISQVLIFEATPRESSAELSPAFILRPSPSS